VAGANFLLQTIRDEAFTFTDGRKDFVIPKDGLQESDDLFPYLLVNIGSGVSIIKVDKDGFERVGGTNIGGGTFWGLCRLLTGLKDFDEMLACSADGDNSKVDMLVGDIYGGRDYADVGLSSGTIASSFGRVVMDEGSLEDYNKADITLSLLRMISYNISHIATMTAEKHGLKRIFFGGYFIRGHAYTMNTISFAVDYWSKGGLKAMFLQHEGFLGALGAFLQDDEANAQAVMHVRSISADEETLGDSDSADRVGSRRESSGRNAKTETWCSSSLHSAPKPFRPSLQ
jgi:type II pantothenate kinase